MPHILAVSVILLFLQGCIGAGLSAPRKDPFFEAWVGRSRDMVITSFGIPNRSAKLDGGERLMEYAARRRVLHRTRPDESDTCTTNFFLKGSRVSRVTTRGIHDICAYFLDTGERSYVVNVGG